VNERAFTPIGNKSGLVNVALNVDIAVIGAGKAGLSSAYHLQRLGLVPGAEFLVFDQSPRPGGVWQFRWPSLTLTTVYRIHNLPGMRFEDAVDTSADQLKASEAVPQYYTAYEQAFGLKVCVRLP
jgi:cation diffusion facilitator CzcD-associated flavoprotein CzcO